MRSARYVWGSSPLADVPVQPRSPGAPCEGVAMRVRLLSIPLRDPAALATGAHLTTLFKVRSPHKAQQTAMFVIDTWALLKCQVFSKTW